MLRIFNLVKEELEITDVIMQYYQDNLLNVIKMDKGTVWLDTGTIDSLMEASQFVHVLETASA